MFLDKLITGLFVAILGFLWFFTRHYEIPQSHRIVIYDVLGNQVDLDGIRTQFNTHTAAISFATQYRKQFPNYNFVLASGMPRIKRRFLISIHR